MKRTYGGLIRELGLTPCHGIGPTGHYCHLDHRLGVAEPGVVHVTDKVVPHDGGWPDKKRFLLLCARALAPAPADEPLWRTIYRENMSARKTGKLLHIRVPARYHKFDKMVVLSGVAGLSNDVPLRKQAFDWARR